LGEMDMGKIKLITGRPFLAEDCLPAQPIEGLLTRNLPLKLDASAAISDSLLSLTI